MNRELYSLITLFLSIMAFQAMAAADLTNVTKLSFSEIPVLEKPLQRSEIGKLGRNLTALHAEFQTYLARSNNASLAAQSFKSKQGLVQYWHPQ